MERGIRTVREYTCTELDLLAYLSDALPAEEREAVSRHVETCQVCQGDLEQMKQAEAIVPLALDPVLPPESLRTRVLEEAFRRRPPISKRNDGGANAHSSRKNDARWVRRILPWFVSAVLLVVSLGLTQQIVHDGKQLKTLKVQLANSTRTVDLQSTHVLHSARGKAVLIPQNNGVQLIVYISNVKPTQSSEVYHVWLLNHGARVSAGVMTTSARGIGVLQVSLAGSRAEFDGIGITLEPNAQTTVPTGPKVLGTNSL